MDRIISNVAEVVKEPDEGEEHITDDKVHITPGGLRRT